MKQKKQKSIKEPSLLGKIITIYFERAKRRKAIRILEKQQWAYEFLSLVLVDAAKRMGTGYALEIINNDGRKLRLTYDKAMKDELDSESILDRLDDDIAVNEFIAKHSSRSL